MYNLIVLEFEIFREVGNINILVPIEINTQKSTVDCGAFRDIGWIDTYENCLGNYLGMYFRMS